MSVPWWVTWVWVGVLVFLAGFEAGLLHAAARGAH
jgi:hypothetical protein